MPLDKGLATSTFLDHNALGEIWLLPSSDEFLYLALGKKTTLSLHCDAPFLSPVSLERQQSLHAVAQKRTCLTSHIITLSRTQLPNQHNTALMPSSYTLCLQLTAGTEHNFLHLWITPGLHRAAQWKPFSSNSLQWVVSLFSEQCAFP